MYHKVAPRPQIQPELAKKTPSQNHSQNSTFRSVRGSNSCYIGNQPLCFHYITLGKVITAQDAVPVKILELKRGFIHHKVVPRPQKRPRLVKNMRSQNHLQNSMFGSVRGSGSCIGYQPHYYHQMTLSDVIRNQEGVPASQSGSPNANTA